MGRAPGGLAARLARGTITVGEGRGTSPARSGDGRRLPLPLQVEDVLGLGLGQWHPSRVSIDGRVILGGRAASRPDARRRGRLAAVAEHPRHRGGWRDEGDDAPVGTAARADQRQGLEPACAPHGSQVVSR